MSATLVTAADAGWYHDPSDSGSWRWWDGATWTSHVHAKEAAASIAVAQQEAAPGIPQPAQPIQPISLTPKTPASEQEYWHSPAAEVVHIPGRSLTSHSSYSDMNPGGSARRPYSLEHEWGDVGSPQTPGIWLLASLPILSVGLQVVWGAVAGVTWGTTGTDITPPNLVFYGILLTLTWIFAGLDIRALAARRYNAPKIWWMLLLPPLVYFIARGKVVRREGQRAWPPELLYFLGVAVGFLFIAFSVVMLLSLMGGIPGLSVS